MKKTMKKSFKKIIAFVLSLAMIFSIADLSVLAAANTDKKVDDKTITVDEVDYSYKVTLPAGYDQADTSKKYPVLYLMPDDGISGNAQAITEQMEASLESSDIMDVIVVEPVFISKEDNSKAGVYNAVSAIINEVDAAYNTVADPSARAVVGAQTGGYLASILTYTDGQGTWVGTPTLFGMMASINGDFQSEKNVWKDVYGDFYDIATNNGEGNGNFSNAIANTFYTFMDAASEDENASVDKGANDIISYYINRGGAYGGFYYGYYGNADSYALDLTVKSSAYDDAFMKTSVKEAVNGIGNKLVQNMVSGKITLTPQAALASVEAIEGVYEITVGDLYTSYCGDAENDLELTVSMTDTDTGEKVADDQTVTFKVKESAEGTTYTNADEPLKLANKINNVSTTVTLSCKILGKEVVLETKPLVRISATGSEPEDQLIDLLGNWKFMAAGRTITAGQLPTEEEYSTWEEVYPCLDWWNSDFSKVTDMNNYVGYAWYVKEFEIPSDFPEGNYVVPVGFFDETDICFINGHLIGATGLDAETWGNPEDKWDTERIYSISSDYLNIGGKNVMTVLTYNRSGGGGWYSGHPGLYSAAAYNKLTSKPSTVASDEDAALVKETVNAQISAITAKDINAYAATVDPEYFQSGDTKDMILETVSSYMDGDGDVSVADTNAYVFVEDDLYYYQADRALIKADGSTSEQSVTEYYKMENGKAVLYGQHDRFYTQTISSEYRAQALGSDEKAVDENFLVYLPEGYFDPENADKRYPTAYVFHQLNSSSNSYAIDGIDQLIDEGIADGSIKDTILVIPDSTGSSWWRNGWDKMVTEEILPFVDSHYRTIQDARYRFTAGASMGGSGSYYIGLTNPDLFSGIISFFGAINMGANPLNIANSQSGEYLGYYTHYFVCGNRDLYKFGIPAITLDKKLRENNISHFFEIEEGEHNSAFYLPYVKDAFAYQTDAMTMLSKNTAKNMITSAQVEASVTEENSIEVVYSAKVTKEIEKYLNKIPASDYTKNENPALVVPVTIEIEQDGKVVASKVVTKKIKGAATIANTVEMTSTDLDTTKEYTVKVKAGILNQNVIFGDTTLTPEQSAAANVDALIAAIGTVNKDSKAAIDAAQAAYDALSEEEKAMVTKADLLQSARQDYAEITNSAAAITQAKANAAAVEQLIAAIGTVDANSKAKIDAARQAYNALDELSQVYVSNYATLRQAEVSYTDLTTLTKLSKPAKTTVTVKKSGKKALKVSWKKIKGATGYKIYRSTKKNKGYKLVKTVKKASTVTWKDKSVKKGKKYYYRVRVYKKVDGVNIYSKYSNKASKKR